MEYRPLGGTGLRVSSIGMGCVTFGREIDRATSFAVLDHARERGITLFDTAEAYAGGASETVLGEWLADRKVRDQIVLATKVAGTLTRKRVTESAEESLRRLRTDRIDLFQVHNWDDETPIEETLDALNSLVEQGKARFVGCSNYAAWQLAKALLSIAGRNSAGTSRTLAPIASVQEPYNLVQREIESNMLPLCRDQQIGVIAYSPLAAGFLTGKYRRGGPVPAGTRFDISPGHQPIYFTPHGYAILQKLEKASEKTGRSMVQLALAWVIGRPAVTSVLVGARNPAQVDQAFDAEQAGLDAETAALFDE
jgi:aryl-alcohol dehydrogenase-like predicted oxidoreductase